MTNELREKILAYNRRIKADRAELVAALPYLELCFFCTQREHFGYGRQ